jgi:hypothetical protein
MPLTHISNDNTKKKVCSIANPEIIFHATHTAIVRFKDYERGDDVPGCFSYL